METERNRATHRYIKTIRKYGRKNVCACVCETVSIYKSACIEEFSENEWDRRTVV